MLLSLYKHLNQNYGSEKSAIEAPRSKTPASAAFYLVTKNEELFAGCPPRQSFQSREQTEKHAI